MANLYEHLATHKNCLNVTAVCTRNLAQFITSTRLGKKKVGTGSMKTLIIALTQPIHGFQLASQSESC